MDPGYGATAFLELSWAPSDAFSVQARGIVSPVDSSGTALLGASWNIYQGFTLSGTASACIGGANDGDLAFLVGLRYRF